MKIRIPKRVFDRMTPDELDNIERTDRNLRGMEYLGISLLDMEQDRIAHFRAALVRLKDSGTRKLVPIIRDIDRWTDVLDGSLNSGDIYPKTLEHFTELATQYIMEAPGHRVYIHDESSQLWLPYYVNYIEHQRERRERDGYIQAAYVEFHLIHWLLGRTYRKQIPFHNEHVNGYNVAGTLAAKGIYIETEEFRSDYLATQEKFVKVFEDVGTQYLSNGHGFALKDRTSSYRTYSTPMMTEGVPSKVVVDVTEHPSDERQGTEAGYPRANFWNLKRPRAAYLNTTEDLSLNEDPVVQDTISEPPEIPVHPFVPVYHLERHQRYRVDVSDLTKYEYDKTLGEQLILPDITKRLVDVLVSQSRISFKDIIEGKGAGACLLLGGPPGVGKTLTAEVFSEATERPLLSVQAAQLGTNPDTIEQELRNILSLGSRWNAVVLLDEADVYIAKRGSALQQNAIVATFLRVLENHTATIFMTTNRVSDVDDAVLSRCMARITYKMPDTTSQKKIWKVISDLNDVDLCETSIEEIVARHDRLSGRDIKQVVKLASLWAARHEEPVTPATVDFVTEFLPTLMPEEGSDR